MTVSEAIARKIQNIRIVEDVTAVWFVGVLSCWYHGVGFWVGVFWPWYIGAVFSVKFGG